VDARARLDGVEKRKHRLVQQQISGIVFWEYPVRISATLPVVFHHFLQFIQTNARFVRYTEIGYYRLLRSSYFFIFVINYSASDPTYMLKQVGKNHKTILRTVTLDAVFCAVHFRVGELS
jgi:hypothetical protein